MAIKINKRKLSELRSDELLRIDSKFHLDFKGFEWDVFRTASNNLISLKELMEPYYDNFEYRDGDKYKGIPTGREYIDEFGFITAYQEVTKDDHPGRLKYKIDNDCILISSLKGAITPALNFDFDLDEYVFSNGFYIFKPKEGSNKKFLLYFLRNQRIKYLLDNVLYRGIGISTYREDDLLHLKIPYVSKAIQNEVVKKIETIEKKLVDLISKQKDDLIIINQVFGEELGFDWEKFNKLKSQKIFKSSLGEFSNNVDCRISYKFHNKAGKYVYDFLSHLTTKRIKDFTEKPIVLGKSVSPKDYDKEGKYYYIAMSNIKTWAFESEDCNRVNEIYWLENLHKTVQKNDILLARSGEGTIGKVALIEEKNIKAIFADFTQRIRLTNYNHRLAYYYFRSDLFQYLVYAHKKGLGNNTNIFPSQIQEFPIPDWTMTKQNEIVKKIKTQIDVQRVVDSEIKKKQDEISQLIEDTIMKEII